MTLTSLLFPLFLTTFTLNAQGRPARPDAPRTTTFAATPDTALLWKPFEKADAAHFLRPQRIFYPETWFHFVNGNVSRAGITKDLEAIAAAGITGVQFFHGKQGKPDDWPGTKEHIECLSPRWEELVRFAASEAHRMGLRFSLQTCPGWATSGGPWIKPEQAMRHLAYSRTDVPGGTPVDTLLPVNASKAWQDWRDIAVLAFPTPEGDNVEALKYDQIRAGLPQQQAQWEGLLREGKPLTLPPTTAEKPHRLHVSLQHGPLARSLEFNPIDLFNHEWVVQPDIHLRISATHKNKPSTLLMDTDFPRANWQDKEANMTFALSQGAEANEYDIEIVNLHPMRITCMRFLSAARGDNWETEAGWTLRSLLRPATPLNEDADMAAKAFVRRDALMDLSQHMDEHGRLQWQAPAEIGGTRVEHGWTILRIGHINTGQRNGPAPAEATGWEVNKLDTAFVGFQFRSYIGRLVDGPLKGLVDNMLMDSWECRSQTWTRFMEQEFQQRRHYALRPWMPALFGFIVGNREQTARFLCDWRRTINELFSDNFYGYMSRMAREKGMTVSYETAAGDIFPADPMEYYKWADVPMTEFWQPFSHWLANHNYKPIRPAASAAHMYGKPRVTAESFTSFALTWDEHLSMLREVANQNLLEGVTHMVFHTYTHNPDADRHEPGTSFGGGIGTPFLRRQTWWWAMPRFTTYLARCSYMLERGLPVSTVLLYLGDEIQQKPDQYAAFPEGYRYDYCNTDALLHRIQVVNGKWTTPEGIQYDVLWIPQRQRMLPQVAERLQALSAAGGIIVGDAPLSVATRTDDHSQAQRWQQAVDKLWGTAHGGSNSRNVLQGCTLQQALDSLRLPPDVKPTSLQWMHRRTEGADWYMICAPQGKGFSGEASFLQKGQAELWNPMTGQASPIGTTPDGPYSRISLQLEQGECLFLVFHHTAATATAPHAGIAHRASATKRQLVPVGTDGAAPWTLTFPNGWGIGQPIQLTALVPWKDLPISAEGRAFSGTATYETTLRLPRLTKGCRYILSLGRVEEIAEVAVNGHVCDTLWAAPYETDVTRHLHKGINQLRIRATSTWFNRLAYDAALPETERRTWVISGPKAGTPLRESGLLGPAVLREEQAPVKH